MIAEGPAGYANPLAAITPSWRSGFPPQAKPYARDPERARELMSAAAWPQGRPLRLATPGDFEGIARLVAADVEEALGLDVELTVVAEEQAIPGARMLVEKKLTPPWDVLLHFWFDLLSEGPPAAVSPRVSSAPMRLSGGPEVPQSTVCSARWWTSTSPTGS